MTRLRIVHRTGFSYPSPASASYNEARMTPIADGRQFVLHSALEVKPAATQHAYTDYWGTRVSTFEALTPHRELSVTATSVVEVGPAVPPSHLLDWDELVQARGASVSLAEALEFTNFTEPAPAVVELAASIAATGLSPYDTALEVCRAIGERLEYVPGVTGVHTTAADAWVTGKGVCQDIAYVVLGALRSLGIPARYVSGYLHPKPGARPGETVRGESHAWVEWFAGEWCGYDPTNRRDIGEYHVTVGRGRDYSDVPPLKGVYTGADSSQLFVSVEITRER